MEKYNNFLQRAHRTLRPLHEDIDFALIYMMWNNKGDRKKKHKQSRRETRGNVYLALMGKFWLRSRISFKESNFGTDKILDAAWKLRSAQTVTTTFLFVSKMYHKLGRTKYR